MLKQLTYIFLSILAYTEVYSQTYNFKNFNVAEGLEQSDVTTISQAKNGSLLYGTNGGGIGIYDGYDFSSFKKKSGLSQNEVFSLDVENNGDLWVATKEGITLLNKEVNRVKKIYHQTTSFYWVYVNKNTNETWFGSAQGIYKFNPDRDSVEFFNSGNELLNNSFINCIYTDAENRLWVGTKSTGVFVIDSDKKVHNYSTANGIANNYIKTIIEAKKGEILIGTIDGINLIKNNVVSKIELPKEEGSHLTFTSSVKYKNQLVFGALNNYLYFIDIKTLKPTWITPLNGFKYQKVWAIFTDKEENLWLGTRGQGLVKFEPIFTYFNTQNKLISNYINSVYENAQNKLFVGTNGGYNIINKDGSVESYQNFKDLGFTNVYHFNEYHEKFFIGTNNGLFLYRDNKTTPIPFVDPAIKEENVFSSFVFKNNFYVGGKMGLYILKNDSLHTVQSFPKEFIYDIKEYKGQLYLACNKGIYRFNGEEVVFYSKEQGIDCAKARCLRIDTKNNLWIGTNEGAYQFNGKTFKKLEEKDGLTSENIYLMEIDGKGNLWIGTNKGLDKVSIESIYQKWNNPTNKLKIRSYSKNEGFDGVECNLNAVFRNKKNQLFFGTINGLYQYHLANDVVNIQPPKVVIKNIKLNFEDVDWKNYTDEVDDEKNIPLKLELKHNNNNLIFEFVGVSLTNPSHVQYQYKLEGLDENWLPLTKDRKAVYTAIPHGNYSFKIRAKNSDEIWSSQEETFTFSILPPWYKTNLFYGLSILTVLTIGYLIIVVRTRNLKKTQVILTTKVEERTKELRDEKEKVESINSTLAEQKKVIEVANKNITDSINYAKKIQDAILPRSTKLNELNDSVAILYLPKDVVSGDFYWFEKIGNKYIYATADCTGHGVPGAFMSMIGVNNLNQIIVENKITSPDKILKELNIAVKKVLKQDDEDSESRDGMDISISCFDLDKKVISYAGAFRPLTYIRNNELFEIKGSRNPIGGSAPIDFNYELHEFDYQKDDVFYMFSDGFPDQFGGAKGKKFMNKQLKEVFMKIYKFPPLKQKELLKQELENWRGNNEQIDDVLVMCVKIS